MTQNEERGEWVSLAKKEHPGLFSELDVLLRALDRVFIVENLPVSSEDLTTKSFLEELVTVRDAILRVLGVLEVVIPENRKNAYWFQKFTESKFSSDRRRHAFREELYRQDSPEKGLYLIFDSFINLKSVITDLLRSGAITYLGFMNVGQLVSKEIRENHFFNPFRMPINPEFDIISNHEISEIVKAIPERGVRQQLSALYLYLFRFLRFLKCVDVTSHRPISLSCSFIVLILLRSEIQIFQASVGKSADKIQQPELEMLLKSIGYQFAMETRRVYVQELKDVLRKKPSVQFRGKIENSHGILKNLTEQSIVQLSQFFRPGISGEQIFDSFVTRLEQSLRLREDIMVFHRFVSLLLSKAENGRERLKVITALKNFILYFESFTFRLIRHDDYEEFALFCNQIKSLNKETATGAGFSRTLEKVQHFKIYLETTLRHISHRSELNDRPVDNNRLEILMEQYL